MVNMLHLVVVHGTEASVDEGDADDGYEQDFLLCNK